jgi:hypothetical protein
MPAGGRKLRDLAGEPLDSSVEILTLHSRNGGSVVDLVYSSQWVIPCTRFLERLSGDKQKSDFTITSLYCRIEDDERLPN